MKTSTFITDAAGAAEVQRKFAGGARFVLRIEQNGTQVAELEVLEPGEPKQAGCIYKSAAGAPTAVFVLVDHVLGYLSRLNREAAAGSGVPLAPPAVATAAPARRLRVQRVPRRRS